VGWYPILWDLSLKYLSIPGNDWERVFSKTGEIFNDKRLNINPQNVKKITVSFLIVVI